MPPLSLRGSTATAFLEWVTPSSLSSLAPYTSTLSVILNEKGGVIDDTIITKHAQDAFYVVTNAGRRDRDIQWITEKLNEWNSSERGESGPVEMEILEGWGLLALQGRSSEIPFNTIPLSRICRECVPCPRKWNREMSASALFLFLVMQNDCSHHDIILQVHRQRHICRA
jgi:hypothetical protein